MKGGGWQPYTIGETITLTNVGDTVQFQDLNPGTYSSMNHRPFKMTGKIAASGNIQSMLNYSDECIPYCYYRMFNGCTSLVTAPELPATTLANGCYHSMFSGCTSLATAPELPATHISNSAYQGMFSGCTSLTKAPTILPIQTGGNRCCCSMFSGCTSLTKAPELPWTR